MAMTTGRGIGAQYLYWLDTAFAIRGPLVAHVAHCFEGIWRASLRRFPAFRGRLAGPGRSWVPRYVSTLPSEDAALRDVDELMRWWSAPAAQPTARARILHHDFLQQIERLTPAPGEAGVAARLRFLKDPVVDALVERLATARRVRLATVSAILHPAVCDALIAARRRGAQVTILVNSATPRLGRDRTPIEQGGSVWAMEAPDLDALLAAGVEVYAFQIHPARPWLFLHRKLAVLDDTAIIGSHNFNVPSTAFFDEASIELEHPRLAAELASLFDRDLATNGQRLDADLVRAERRRLGARLLRWLSFPYLGYM
jgi:phosphatidylserine/phosphatidylglycerophosphate/cardiolipin synthase-like enzyme